MTETFSYLTSFFLFSQTIFREIYEFPLSQSDMALQTLNLHICRYDSYSRRNAIGDVFLALAELSAQGIDFTREVFLCRNIISHQEVGTKFITGIFRFEFEYEIEYEYEIKYECDF